MKNLISQVMEDMQETVSPDAVLEVPLETNSFGDHAVGLIDANSIEDIMSVDHDLNEIGNGDDLVDVTKVLIDIDVICVLAMRTNLCLAQPQKH